MSWPTIYRPQQFSQLHLTRVKNNFLNFIKQGYFPQVMLFTGPKGTGKTSTARLLAATLNSAHNAQAVTNTYLKKGQIKTKSLSSFHEPDAKEPMVASILRGQSYCVQEMDAASNRGIDDIRLLKERAQLPPTDGVMAVYILDEAHMLTTQAFNALLKLLEEPPAHTVFILATTEPDKIPDTIKSRCQIIEFHKATPAEIATAIKRVVELEKVTIEPEALDLICRYADGSFRDGLKYLELCAQSGQTITQKLVEEVVSPLFETQAKQLLEFLVQKKSTQLLDLIQTLRQQAVDDKKFIGQLIRLLHTTLVEIRNDLPQSLPLTAKVCQFLLNAFLQPDLILPSPIPLLRLELLCLDLIDRSGQKSGSSPRQVAPTPTSLPETSDQVTQKTTDLPAIDASATKLLERWEDFLQQVSSRNSSLAAFMRSAKPILQNDRVLQLHVYYKFHQQQLNLPKFKQLALEAAAALDLSLPELTVMLTTPAVPSQSDSTPDTLTDRPLTEIASELLS